MALPGGCRVFIALHQIGESKNFGRNLMSNLVEWEWCLGVDINEVLYLSDRKGRTPINSQMQTSNEWVSELI